MIITVTEADQANAIAAYKRGENISKCCIIFQACKRAGLDVTDVGNFSVNCRTHSSKLPEMAQYITLLNPTNWADVKVPFEFELEEEYRYIQ